MIKRISWIFLIAMLASSASSLNAQPKPSPTPTPAQDAHSFADLLQRAKNADATLDFKGLRFAYTATKEYNPYRSSRDDRTKMFAALHANQYEQARDLAETILAQNFIDLNGQFGAFIANRELGNAEKASLHKFLFEGLVRSVESSGDGKTPETAFIVISVDEEYVLLNWLGLRATGQSLVNQNGHSYDLMKAVNTKTNETVSYYFNIDKPFNWLGKSLK
jgi:hypothetical protein